MQFLRGIGEIFREICCPVAADTITDRADVGAVTARLGGWFFSFPSVRLGARPSGKKPGNIGCIPCFILSGAAALGADRQLYHGVKPFVLGVYF